MDVPPERLLSHVLAERAGDLRVRAIYTDLDGTMLGPGGSFFHDAERVPTREPADALLAAHHAGVDVVPASGRALRGLLGDGRIFGAGTVIAEMGALIAYSGGREVVRNFGETPAADDDAMPATIMERSGAVAFLLERHAGRLEFHTPWSAWRECTQLFRGLVDPADADEALAAAGHPWLTLVDNGRLHGRYLGLEPGAARVYHLMPKAVTKGSAVALDRARRGLAADETIAIGDALADLELAGHVGLLVLVRDAVEADEALARRAAGIENVAITERPMNLGWADAVAGVLRRGGGR